MKRKIGKVIMMMAGIAFIAAPAMAEVVFSDDFNDGNRDGWYEYNDADASRSLATSNNYLETVSSGTYGLWGGVANFSGVTLGDAESINLSLDFQIMEDIGGNTILVGLFDSNGTTISADQADLTNLTDESGYYMYNRSADLIMKAGSGTGLGQVNGNDSMVKTQPSPFAVADSTWHTYSLTITNNAGQVTATTVFDAGLASELTQSDSGSAYDFLTFDTIAVQAIRSDFAVDNIVVTHTVPEPATLGLLSIAGLGVYMMRRRKI